DSKRAQKQVALAEALLIVQATEFPCGNESTVCYQTLTLRSYLLNRQNARRESFRALFVGPRAAHFYGPRKLLILSCRIGHCPSCAASDRSSKSKFATGSINRRAERKQFRRSARILFRS